MAGKHEQRNNTDYRSDVRSNRSRGGTAVREDRGARYERSRSRCDEPKAASWLKWAIPVIAVLVAAVIVLAGVMVRASRVSASDTIYPNITVAGVNVGGMTVKEATAALEASDAAPDTEASVTVHFPLDKTLTVTAEELGVKADAAAAAEEAYAYGRGGSLLQNLRTYRACKRTVTALDWAVNEAIDTEALHSLVSEAVSEVNAALLGSDAEIGEDGVTVVKGMNAASIQEETVYQQVLAAFQNKNYEDITVEFERLEGASETNEYEILEAIYDAIFVEPKNAEYDKTTGDVTESVQGVSFDMDEAKKLWDAAAFGDKVFIPFVFTDPEVTTEELSDGLFADLLAEKTTSLSGSSSNRINNITLTAQAVNDTILEPGDTFDYNAVVGQRTTARGYKEAGAYSGGKHVNEVGGGICQTSSTIYYCALYANLRITTRSCHMFAVSYLPLGFDATVSWGGPDFRFVNSRDYPVKLKAWVSNGSLTVQIWGTDADGSYVKMTSDTWEDSVYYYAQTYRTVYAADGSVISSAKEAYSRYSKYEDTGETPVPDTDTTPAPVETPAPTAAPTTAPVPVDTNTPTPQTPPPIQTEPAHTDPPPAETHADPPAENTPNSDPAPVDTDTGGEGGGE